MLRPLEDIPDRYVVVDFQNTLWKSWAVKPGGEELVRDDGYPTGHVYRFFRTIHKWKRDFGGDLVFCYEGGEKHRFSLFPGYKEGRVKDRDFDPAPDVRRLISYLACIELKPVEAEADDAIAYFVRKRGKAKHLILSSDKDLWTLRNDNVSIVSFRDFLQEDYVRKSCKKNFGCEIPMSITLAKALYGDSSDRIPGVPRLLKKHVAHVLEKANTPEEFYANLEGVPPKTVTKLLEYKEQVSLMYEVVKLRPEVRVKRRSRAGDVEGLKSFLREFSCLSLLSQAEFMAT